MSNSSEEMIFVSVKDLFFFFFFISQPGLKIYSFFWNLRVRNKKINMKRKIFLHPLLSSVGSLSTGWLTSPRHCGASGMPRASVTWPSCRFFTSWASQRLVVVSSFRTWAKVLSLSWSGRHWRSASLALWKPEQRSEKRDSIRTSENTALNSKWVNLSFQNLYL